LGIVKLSLKQQEQLVGTVLPEDASTGLALDCIPEGSTSTAWKFNATEGLVALVTTVVGAAIGANLLLIILDISKVRPQRRLADSFPVDPTRQRVGA
jgi:hypothetical protein